MSEVRAMQEQLPGCRGAAYNPTAFPPSLVVRRRMTAGMQEGTTPGKEDNCKDAGGRATQGAVAETAVEERPTSLATPFFFF